jgi:hypothetical protein
MLFLAAVTLDAHQQINILENNTLHIVADVDLISTA